VTVFTEADLRLFPTLVRFDAVYYSHFKCNLRRIADYYNLSNYMREIYQMPGVAETVDIPGIKLAITAACQSQPERAHSARPRTRFYGTARPPAPRVSIKARGGLRERPAQRCVHGTGGRREGPPAMAKRRVAMYLARFHDVLPVNRQRRSSSSAARPKRRAARV